MLSPALKWLWAALPWLGAALPWLTGALMFMIKTNAEDVEQNVARWRLRLRRLSNWIAVQRWSKPLAIVFITFGSGIAGVLITPLLGGYQTDAKFQVAHDSVPEIGSPLGLSEASIVYEEEHEHGLVIWVASLGEHLALLSTSKVLHQPDSSWQVADWNDDATNRKRLNLPSPCDPPLGGVARAWSNDPEKWKVIGCRKWYCTAATSVQQFSDGYLIGPLGYGYDMNPSKQNSRIIVVFKNDTWMNRSSPASATACIPPLP